MNILIQKEIKILNIFYYEMYDALWKLWETNKKWWMERTYKFPNTLRSQRKKILWICHMKHDISETSSQSNSKGNQSHRGYIHLSNVTHQLNKQRLVFYFR